MEQLIYGLVPASIAGGLLISVWMKTRWARRAVQLVALFFVLSWGTLLWAGADCDGHAFIGYAHCAHTPDGIAAVLSGLHEFAVIAYLYAAGPLVLLLLGVEAINRKRNRA
ncbi:hypothetical protein [Rhodovulum sp. FJ3]|uniref:hypothetical protein n=1 Tax=Rhodovulum sp. FJ3 TaxID=3079053 RepID=UPI00293DA596|nr:hypothetical protein [Rhodovulum sp. FJ3]MDV4168298.1 hypothetical protein [Rhodovulum sp. FJ3]